MNDDDRTHEYVEKEEGLFIENELELATDAEWYAAGYISLLVKGVECGDTPIGIPLLAWENTMCAAEWALLKHVAGRLQGPSVVTAEDVDAIRRLRAIGAAALADEDVSPDLAALAEQCLEALLGPKWKTYLRRAEGDVCRLL